MKKIVHILKKEDKRLLHSFLKANNALTQFKRNCRYRGLVLPFYHLTNPYDPKNVIMLSFGWDDQPEGGNYWCKLSREWRHFFELRKMHK